MKSRQTCRWRQLWRQNKGYWKAGRAPLNEVVATRKGPRSSQDQPTRPPAKSTTNRAVVGTSTAASLLVLSCQCQDQAVLNLETLNDAEPWLETRAKIITSPCSVLRLPALFPWCLPKKQLHTMIPSRLISAGYRINIPPHQLRSPSRHFLAGNGRASLANWPLPLTTRGTLPSSGLSIVGELALSCDELLLFESANTRKSQPSPPSS